MVSYRDQCTFPHNWSPPKTCNNILETILKAYNMDDAKHDENIGDDLDIDKEFDGDS